MFAVFSLLEVSEPKKRLKNWTGLAAVNWHARWPLRGEGNSVKTYAIQLASVNFHTLEMHYARELVRLNG